MSHHSITETCFFVAPINQTSNRKRKRGHEFQHNAHLFQQDVDAILDSENSVLVKEVVTYMQAPLESDHLGKLKCGLIISGGDSNTDRLYRRATRDLTTSTSVVVDLEASECNNLKSALKVVVQSTISCGSPIRNLAKLQSHDMRLVEAWQAHQRVCKGAKMTIIIAMRHLERTSSSVLNQLVNVLSLYSLDFKFLCSISSTLNQLRDIFSIKTIRKLYVTKFEVDPKESTLEKVVMDQLIERYYGLRLGFETFNALWSDYQGAHRSVDQFVSAFKYIRVCHEYANEVTFLAETNPEQLDAAQCEKIRSLRSFRQFVHDAESSDDLRQLSQARQALMSDSALMELVGTFLLAIDTYKLKLCHAFKCFLVIKEHSKSTVKLKSVTELYRIVLQDGLHGSNTAKELLMSLRLMRKESLFEILKNCEAMSTDSVESNTLHSFLQKLDAIDQMPDLSPLAKSREERKLALGFKDSRPVPPSPRELQSEHEQFSIRSTRDTIASRKTVLEATKNNMTEKEKCFTALVDSVNEYFTTLFEHLINHEHLTLHELFWANIDRNHKATFSPNIRLHARSALSDHELYLGKTDIEPHTSALFRLFQDGGQLINLYDWFQAFKQVYSPNVALPDHDGLEESIGEEGDDDDEEAKLQQALFVRSVAELKFLGLFKSTKRKTDHVQKTISIL